MRALEHSAEEVIAAKDGGANSEVSAQAQYEACLKSLRFHPIEILLSILRQNVSNEV